MSIGTPEVVSKNFKETIKEYESGHFLASAFITSRVIRYILDKIEGETDDEKIRSLISRGVIQKNRKDIHTSIIKASRRSRNYLSHDIGIFPDSSDSLSLLGDSISLLKYYISYVKIG